MTYDSAEIREAQEYFGFARSVARLREFDRRVYRLKGLPKEIAEAIQTSKMNSSHDDLNTLLEDK